MVTTCRNSSNPWCWRLRRPAPGPATCRGRLPSAAASLRPACRTSQTSLRELSVCGALAQLVWSRTSLLFHLYLDPATEALLDSASELLEHHVAEAIAQQPLRQLMPRVHPIGLAPCAELLQARDEALGAGSRRDLPSSRWARSPVGQAVQPLAAEGRREDRRDECGNGWLRMGALATWSGTYSSTSEDMVSHSLERAALRIARSTRSCG